MDSEMGSGDEPKLISLFIKYILPFFELMFNTVFFNGVRFITWPHLCEAIIDIAEINLLKE